MLEFFNELNQAVANLLGLLCSGMIFFGGCSLAWWYYKNFYGESKFARNLAIILGITVALGLVIDDVVVAIYLNNVMI